MPVEIPGTVPPASGRDRQTPSRAQGEPGQNTVPSEPYGLRALSIDDLAIYQAALEAGRQTGWRYNFPALLTSNRPGRRQKYWTIDSGSFCVFQWQRQDGQERLDVFLAPSPMEPDVLRRCIERANDFNGDRSARVLHIDEADRDAVMAAGLDARPRKEQYIFAPERYSDLGGKELYTVRRKVNRFARLPDVEIRPFQKSDATACRKLLDQWKVEHRRVHKTLGGVGTSRRSIDLAGHLPERILGGQIILIGETLAAFALGGMMRQGLACSIERKCATSVAGLGYFQLQHFLLSFKDFGLVNDGSDAGRAGLRQLKSSFRPVAMHREFRARQLEQT